jgi:8-oxo-dGTP diphosphatase
MREIAAVILENHRGEILLYLRDNKPTIPFPHHWDLFGGHVEAGETPEQALRREVKEELDLELKDYTFFRKYQCLEGDAYPNVKHVFVARIDKDISELTLHEGERLQFFSKAEIPTVKFANILQTIVMDYLETTNRAEGMSSDLLE